MFISPLTVKIAISCSSLPLGGVDHVTRADKSGVPPLMLMEIGLMDDARPYQPDPR